MTNKKIVALICIMVLVFLGITTKTKANTLPPNHTNVELKVTNNGTPVIHTSYSAMNIDRAYQEIKNGTISLAARSSEVWILAAKNTNSVSEDGVIMLSNGQKIGQGITHTDDEMSSIISELIKGNHLPLISVINQSDTSVPFLNPERVVDEFTNKSGKGKAVLVQGYTLILDTNDNFLKLIEVKGDSQKIVINCANIDRQVKFSVDEQLDALATNFGGYVVGTNQKISFNLSINKEVWEQAEGIDLVLPPKSNLAFDAIEVLENNDAVTVVTTPESSDAREENYTKPVVVAHLTLNPTQNDIRLRITVHVALSDNNVTTSEPIQASMHAITRNKDSSSNRTLTPTLIVAGANFAMTEKNATQFAQGGKFVLAKSMREGYEIYGNDQQWHQIDDLKAIKSSDALILEGGKRYVLGSEQAQKIPLILSKFSYSKKNSEKINKSLIQILGLEQGNHYFLYRVDREAKASQADNLFKFSIFSRNYFSSNNTLEVENSINYPTEPLVAIASQIPDHVAGANEYNSLGLDGSKEALNKHKLSIFVGLGLIIALVLTTSIGLIAQGRW